MGAWVRVAEFTKAKHLKGGLVARSVAGLPFLLEEGLFCAFVPPVIDVPRQGTVVEVRPEARGGATVFFDTVVDANQADALVGCYVLARREDLPDDVLELQESTTRSKRSASTSAPPRPSTKCQASICWKLRAPAMKAPCSFPLWTSFSKGWMSRRAAYTSTCRKACSICNLWRYP